MDNERKESIALAWGLICAACSAFWLVVGLAIGTYLINHDSPEHRLNWTAETHIGCRVDWISDLRVCHWALPDGTTVDTRSM